MAQIYNLEEEARRHRAFAERAWTPAYRMRRRVQDAFENLRQVLAGTDDFERVQAAIDALQEAVEQAKIPRPS